MNRERPTATPQSRDNGEDDHAAGLARARFVLLTTYRASGEPVATAVWIVADGNQLAVLTNADSGKVRRLRRNPSVTMVPCTPRGEPNPSVSPTRGRAEILDDHDALARLWRLARRKYTVEHLVLRVLGRLKPAWNRWNGPQVVLRITPE